MVARNSGIKNDFLISFTGIVPGEGEMDIVVTYTPKEYVTANMTIQLAISQFNTEPMQCHITGSCTPIVKHTTAK